MTPSDETYENALRAAREVWEPDSTDFARRDVLDCLRDATLAKIVGHGLSMGMGWIKLREMVEGALDDAGILWRKHIDPAPARDEGVGF